MCVCFCVCDCDSDAIPSDFIRTIRIFSAYNINCNLYYEYITCLYQYLGYLGIFFGCKIGISVQYTQDK